MSRFGYPRDPLCGLSLAAYATNHLLVVPHLPGLVQARVPWAWPFLHSHFDDLLLIPAALPVVLWLQRLLGLRTHDRTPTWTEMLAHLAIWSVICKGAGPLCLHVGAADPWDILFFAAGGGGAMIWWRHQRRAGSPQFPRAL